MKRSPFKNAVLDFKRHNLVLIPLTAKQGKMPGVKWRQWQKGQRRETREQLARNFPAANVALICGKRNRITVLDGDSACWEFWERLGGETPLKVATPSGGVHLYYKHNGERPANLRSKLGVAGDIKGEASYVVAPPSFSFRTGLGYRVVSGSFDMIRSGELPTMKDFMPRAEMTSSLTRAEVRAQEGERNDSLFRYGLSIAVGARDIDEIIGALRQQNNTFTPPLSESEVVGVAAQVWRYQREGKNVYDVAAKSSRQYFQFPARLQQDAISRGYRNAGDIVMLWVYLRSKGRVAPVKTKLVSASIARELGINPERITRARDCLMEMGVIERLAKKDGRAYVYKVKDFHEIIRIPSKLDSI